MKKINRIALSFLLVSVGMVSSAFAQQEAKTLFVNMPDSLNLFLTAVNRADCIDFLESKMKAKVENRFGKESEMTDLTKDYIRMQMSSQSTWQMKLLPLSDSTQVICVISTACAPACDSGIRFYSTEWKELPLSDFLAVQPVMDDFFIAPDAASNSASDSIYEYNDARLKADLYLVKMDLSKSDNTLAFALTTPEYMEKETAEKLKPFLRRPIVYVWKDGKFTLQDIPQ